MESLLAFGMPAGPEWFAIIFVVVLLFGAKKLPELARGLGRSMGEFKKARDEFAHEMEKATTEPQDDKLLSGSVSQPRNSENPQAPKVS
jgi:TatA/E family protein of Tat protein translocase